MLLLSVIQNNEFYCVRLVLADATNLLRAVGSGSCDYAAVLQSVSVCMSLAAAVFAAPTMIN